MSAYSANSGQFGHILKPLHWLTHSPPHHFINVHNHAFVTLIVPESISCRYVIYSTLIMTIMTYSAKLITHKSGSTSVPKAHNQAARPNLDFMLWPFFLIGLFYDDVFKLITFMRAPASSRGTVLLCFTSIGQPKQLFLAQLSTWLITSANV